MVLFILNIVMVWFNPDEEVGGLSNTRHSIYMNGGLVYNITMLFINNAIVGPLTDLWGRIKTLFYGS